MEVGASVWVADAGPETWLEGKVVSKVSRLGGGVGGWVEGTPVCQSLCVRVCTRSSFVGLLSCRACMLIASINDTAACSGWRWWRRRRRRRRRTALRPGH